VETKEERNLKAVVEYDGTDFHGWQVQPGLRTVQGVLEDALSALLREEVRLSAAGRTDRGVHAFGQVLNFVTRNPIPLENLQVALNLTLPDDIFTHAFSEAPRDFHARFSAKQRTYIYRIGLWGAPESPFLRRYCWFPGRPLDLAAMRKAAAHLVGTRDFRALAGRIEPGDDAHCEVTEVSWTRSPLGYTFRVSANRFLPQMIRRILAVLVDIGSGECSPSTLERILEEGKEAWRRPWVAPPQGLFLRQVQY
jgi:tRNA pseudouridine38-40 synthase